MSRQWSIYFSKYSAANFFPLVSVLSWTIKVSKQIRNCFVSLLLALWFVLANHMRNFQKSRVRHVSFPALDNYDSEVFWLLISSKLNKWVIISYWRFFGKDLIRREIGDLFSITLPPLQIAWAICHREPELFRTLHPKDPCCQLAQLAPDCPRLEEAPKNRVCWYKWSGSVTSNKV